MPRIAGVSPRFRLGGGGTRGTNPEGGFYQRRRRRVEELDEEDPFDWPGMTMDKEAAEEKKEEDVTAFDLQAVEEEKKEDVTVCNSQAVEEEKKDLVTSSELDTPKSNPPSSQETCNASPLDAFSKDEIDSLTQDLNLLLDQATHAIFHKKAWRRHYKRLCQYRQQHGHCRVPLFERRGDSLGMWLELQRDRYQKLGAKKAFYKKKYLQKLNQVAPEWLENPDVFDWREEGAAPKGQRPLRISALDNNSDNNDAGKHGNSVADEHGTEVPRK